MSDIDKNIEILKELIKNANIEDADMNECFGGEHIIAIDNVLKEFEETQAELKRKIEKNYEMSREITKIVEKRIKEVEEEKINKIQEEVINKYINNEG